MPYALFIELMRLANEVLTAAVVIVAASLLLYNLTRGIKDRVTKSSSVVLGAVTMIYLSAVFVQLAKQPASIEVWLRLGWVGFAFAPAGLFHLSDALLSTTGLVSRGRRRRVVRILYFYSVAILIMATSSNELVKGLILTPFPLLQPGRFFFIYPLFYAVAAIFAFNNVLRARRRCLTAATKRRMTYLLLALIAPIVAIFPYSLLFTQSSTSDAAFLWALVNLRNFGIILMLMFLAYPLAFFGPSKPDRVIKAELLSFMLRGPVLGISVLVVILFVPRLDWLGLPAGQLMPFVAVSVVLFLQWVYTLIVPYLERKLIYTEDQEDAKQLSDLAERLLTPADARQLLEAVLASACDFLRVPSAFVLSVEGDTARVERTIGLSASSIAVKEAKFTELFRNTPQPLVPNKANGASAYASNYDESAYLLTLVAWGHYWVVPLYSTRGNSHSGQLIGVFGITARDQDMQLQPEEETVFKILVGRAARIVDDMKLQDELLDSLQDAVNDRPIVTPVRPYVSDARQLTNSLNAPDEFNVLVKDALRDFWGGPRLTDERLFGLQIFRQALTEHNENPERAVRAVLTKAIERLKPSGPRSMLATDWMLYNIIDLRYVQGRKVHDVSLQLAMSEPDLYRKQNIAIKRITEEITAMEQQG